jgi:hypothetical protein
MREREQNSIFIYIYITSTDAELSKSFVLTENVIAMFFHSLFICDVMKSHSLRRDSFTVHLLMLVASCARRIALRFNFFYSFLRKINKQCQVIVNEGTFMINEN